jgi:hypothetical protein
MPDRAPDQARAEQFGERMVGVLNDGLLALMTSIGQPGGPVRDDGGPVAVDERPGCPRGRRERALRAGVARRNGHGTDRRIRRGEPHYDFITAFDAIHDQAHPAVLQAIAVALRPEGPYLMVDINASSKLEDNLSTGSRNGTAVERRRLQLRLHDTPSDATLAYPHPVHAGKPWLDSGREGSAA